MPRALLSPTLDPISSTCKVHWDHRPARLPACSTSRRAALSEHPPAKLIAGQTLVRSVVNELMRSPEWSSTAFVLTYDSWGGWYDHVRPPSVDRYGYGFRVRPCSSAPMRDAERSTTPRSTLTSILRFIEDNWQLAPLAQRDASAQSIASAFDFSSPPRAPEFVPTSAGAPRVAAAHTRVVFWAYGDAILLALVFVAAALASTRHQTGVIAAPAAVAAGTRAEAPDLPWERWPLEPEEAWLAFELYRDLGPGSRSQRAVSTALATDASSAAHSAWRVRQWSVDWHWVERCRAHDEAGNRLEASR